VGSAGKAGGASAGVADGEYAAAFAAKDSAEAAASSAECAGSPTRAGSARSNNLVRGSWARPAIKRLWYRYQCCGSGSGIRRLFDPWIYNPEHFSRSSVIGIRDGDSSDPGSGMEQV
jgi:hypothetical protein